MTLSIDDLITEETPDSSLSSILSIAVALGFPVTDWQPTGMLRNIAVLMAHKASDLSRLVALIGRMGFLELAERGWLTMLAKATYNVDRIPATFAQTSLTLTNASVAAFDAPALSLHFVTPLGLSFTNLNVVHVNASSAASIPIRAEVAGAAGGTTGAGSITALATPVIGLTMTNAAGLVGYDEESDANLRQRCRDKIGSLSFGGPAGAYAYAVKTALTVAPISRATVTAIATNGHVRVVIATSGGAPTSSDLAIAATAAQAYAPQGVTVDVVAAVEHPITFTGDVWVSGSSLTDAQITQAVASSLTGYMSARPIGGDVIPPATTGIVDREAMVARMYALQGTVKATLTAPAADVPLSALEVPTVGPMFSITVHRV